MANSKNNSYSLRMVMKQIKEKCERLMEIDNELFIKERRIQKLLESGNK